MREIVAQGPSTVFCWSNATNYACLSHVGSIIRCNYRAGFRGKLESLKLGRAPYNASQDEGLTDLEVVNGWVERLGVGRWFRWVGFEDMPESYFREWGVPIGEPVELDSVFIPTTSITSLALGVTL